MKQYNLVAVTLLSVLIVGGQVAAQQARDRESRDRERDGEGDRVCFYKDVEYRGPSWCYEPGDELGDLRDIRNEISSIRVSGRARVVVYDLRGFEGVSDEFDMDASNLTLRSMGGSRTWNDRIDSFQVMSTNSGRRGGQYGGGGRDNGSSRDRICVYEDANFRGRSQCWEVGQYERNLNRTSGWNDTISSIRVFGRARVEVYRDADYRGERTRINRDVQDLGALNWADAISSFEVQ